VSCCQIAFRIGSWNQDVDLSQTIGARREPNADLPVPIITPQMSLGHFPVIQRKRKNAVAIGREELIADFDELRRIDPL
jgi:hypothetical protein